MLHENGLKISIVINLDQAQSEKARELGIPSETEDISDWVLKLAPLFRALRQMDEDIHLQIAYEG